MSKSLSSKIAIDALNMAFIDRKPEKGLIFHSDRGVQYASKKFRKKLKKFNMVQYSGPQKLDKMLSLIVR